MRRLHIMVKGNLDVRDSLLYQKLENQLTWNGVNEILRARHACMARVSHETWTRSDALLESGGTIPAALTGRNLPLGPYSLAAQFDTALFESNADVFVLSIQPDICTHLLRHRNQGFLFLPYNRDAWQMDDLAWLREAFIDGGFLEPAQSMAGFRRIIDRIRTRTSAPILVYNVSSFVIGEAVHSHAGLEDLFSTRVRRFNLALVELSEETGISVIDVDRTLAARGCAGLLHDTLHFNAEGCRAVAEEVVRVLHDLGCVDGARE